jgi:hypothetical protein
MSNAVECDVLDVASLLSIVSLEGWKGGGGWQVAVRK